MLDLLLIPMKEELHAQVTLLGDDDIETLATHIVEEYNLNWFDTRFCISRLCSTILATSTHPRRPYYAPDPT